MRKSTIALLVAVALLLPFGHVQAAQPIALQVGAMPIEGAAQVFYAQDQGFFKAAGLDVSTTVLPNGSSIIAALVSGSLNIGFGSPPPLILARQRSLPVRYIAYAPIYIGGPPLSAVMVAKNSPIKSGADLNDKVVAVAGLHDVGQYQVQAWIDKTGGNSSNVHFIEMPYSEMGIALQQGRVAAAGNTEPFITAAKDSAQVVGNMNTAIAPHYLMAGWFATDDWLQKNPEAAKRFIAVMQQTARWANSHPAEAAAILVRYTKITPEIATTMTRDHFDESGRADPKLLQPVIDLMMKYGKLTPFTANELLWSPPR